MSDPKKLLPMEAKPGFFLGTSDMRPEHWGGSPRRCWVVDRPRFTKTGRETWRVRVDPPIPRYQEVGNSIRERISEWILVERYVGERIEDLREGQNVTVNIWRYNDPRAHEKAAFDSVDLALEYIGEVALTADALPEPWDPRKAWERDLGRIRRFVQQHGHSRVPRRYHDEDGTPLDIVVENIRWHHAGRGGWSEGPYPGVEYASDLAGLEGWSWRNEDAAELARLRDARHQAPLMRALGLREGVDESNYIRTVTTALRNSDEAPWPSTRTLIAEKGIDVQAAAIIDLIPIRRNDGYLGALVGPAERIFSFFLGFVGDPEQPERWGDRVFIAEWHELTAEEARRRYGKELDIARHYSEMLPPRG